MLMKESGGVLCLRGLGYLFVFSHRSFGQTNAKVLSHAQEGIGQANAPGSSNTAEPQYKAHCEDEGATARFLSTS